MLLLPSVVTAVQVFPVPTSAEEGTRAELVYAPAHPWPGEVCPPAILTKELSLLPHPGQFPLLPAVPLPLPWPGSFQAVLPWANLAAVCWSVCGAAVFHIQEVNRGDHLVSGLPH